MKFLGKILLALGLMGAPAWAALSTSTIFEVNQAGSNTNAGCFVEGSSGTDNTYPTPTVTTYTDLVIDATTNTNVTSSANPFDSTSPGRCLRISSGTGFTTGLYYVVSQVAGVATLDRAAGTTSSTGGNGKSGGALATLPQLNTDMCSGCRAWVKADAPYVMSAGMTWNYSTSGASWIRGYSSTRGDNGRAEIKSSGSIGGGRLMDINIGGNFTLANFTLNLNSDAGLSCMYFLNQPIYVENLDCKNFNAAGAEIQFNNIRGICRNCSIHDGLSAGGTGFLYNNFQNACEYCSVVNVTGTFVGYYIHENVCLYCAVVNVGTAASASDGFVVPGGNGYTAIDHPLCYGVARDCIRIVSIGQPTLITNGILVNAVNGIDNVSGTTLRPGDLLNDYNFSFNMSGSVVVGLTAGAHSVTLTQTPFINAGSLDFRLNNNFGGGASVRAHGIPNSMPGFLGTYYPDAGIAQHQDPKFF